MKRPDKISRRTRSRHGGNDPFVRRGREDAAKARTAALLKAGMPVLRGPLMRDGIDDADVFIAYARADAAFARALVSDLRAMGYRVGWDRDLPPGKSFRKQIFEALGGVKAVLVVWSQAAFESDFVADEAEVGKERGRLVCTLVPDGVPSSCIPLGFRSLQSISVLDTHEIANALDNLGVKPVGG
jgi:hypothetical protein